MKKILEIGGGIRPYFMRYDIPWNAEDAYLCLDVSEKRIEQSKEAIKELAAKGSPHPAQTAFLLEDGIDIPLTDGSIDEIVISNVLSAPIHNNWDKDGISILVPNPSRTFSRKIPAIGSEQDLFYRERKPLVDEALRLLKPGGKLSIYTDLIIYGIHSYERILGELMNHELLSGSIDAEEQARVDELNKTRCTSGENCYCFNAEVLPRSSVFRFVRK